MYIYGLLKTTLLDYPKHLAATIFTGGCTFRCPYCHNSSLIMPNPSHVLDIQDIFAFLQKRKNILEGICISGGEPTLQPDLKDFIIQIKELGYLVKLDTNGTNPSMLQNLIESKLLDYVAMDIKSSLKNYHTSIGLPKAPLAAIQESASILMKGTIPYEFRTTVIEEMHNADIIRDIARWLQGCEQYYLQNYKESSEVLSTAPLHPCPAATMQTFADIAKEFIQTVGIR